MDMDVWTRDLVPAVNGNFVFQTTQIREDTASWEDSAYIWSRAVIVGDTKRKDGGSNTPYAIGYSKAIHSTLANYF